MKHVFGDIHTAAYVAIIVSLIAFGMALAALACSVTALGNLP